MVTLVKVMKKVKHLKLLLAVSIFLLFCIFEAWNDYTWDARYLNEIGSDWILCDRQTNAIDPIFVWQIFKQPAHRIEIIKKSSISRISPSVYGYGHRWVDRDWSKRIVEEDFISFSDCKNGLVGHIRSDADKSNLNITDIEWEKFDNSPYSLTEADRKMLQMRFSKICSMLNIYGPQQ